MPRAKGTLLGPGTLQQAYGYPLESGHPVVRARGTLWGLGVYWGLGTPSRVKVPHEV